MPLLRYHTRPMSGIDRQVVGAGAVGLIDRCRNIGRETRARVIADVART
jgi:hypothetical protein